ncbi:hypothetical protein SSX86_033156 [Deinandra increscens subsp. villosa]|uniref:TCP domain-containing protein n=1 Tax=Deinandra increscens subsp. villosa TaxID=3103831 RepID=A0AAP0C5U3_9ASTR
MNISNLRESDYEMKQEGGNNGSKSSLEQNLTTSSWSRLKDPRIVRVSRALGGKDRHSKVCTVRGLRDRRVRLSVPTAIQLYDLQDRLGLNQPSKAVDWLLDAAKNEIDELPPLQIPPGISFGQNLQPMQNPSSQERSIQHDQDGTFVQSCNNFFERNPNSSNLPDLLNSHVVPNTSYLKWDPSNLSLSQFGNDQHDHETVLRYHQPPQTQSYFPSHDHNPGEFDPKQPGFQMVSSSSSGSRFTPPLYTINQGMRPFHLRMNSKFFSSEDDGEHGLNK